MASLTEVADQYRAEADRHRHASRAHRDALAMANWLTRAVANRTPDDHHATLATPTWLTTEWAHTRGYQVAASGAGTGAIALILQRGDELLICNLPAHLHWDGHRITLA
jgi:ferric-dicitrate binding protein FerR (iron transport regulator)